MSKSSIIIYHNSRCSKSRLGVELLEKSGKNFKIIKYLETGFNKTQIKEIIRLLDIEPIELVRKNETVWKENYKGRSLTNDQVIEAMVKHPKLIERPVVVNNRKAVIGRPTEQILNII